MNKDNHLISEAYKKVQESWKEVFSGNVEDRWKELTDLQQDLVMAYIDKVRSEFRPSHMAQDIRLKKVSNSPTDPENLKFIHITVPERPEHVVELDTKHNEIYVPNSHPHGGREQAKLKVNREEELI